MDITPYASGLLDVGDGQQIYWECSGNPQGRPIVYLHGGPGSGASERSRNQFDPSIYKIIISDQRGCGRSRPHVRNKSDLTINTTQHLIADIERLREHLNVERWAILGGSWGTTLALAYAHAHPQRVSALVLACVTTTSQREVDWMTYQIGRIFPEQWERFASVGGCVPANSGELLDRYQRLLFADNPATQATAASEWCRWEDVHVSLAPEPRPNARYQDPDYRLLFARIVTHYWKHAGFLAKDQLFDGATKLAGITGIMLHGRYDVSSPAETAWRLHRNWHGSELRIVDESGHGGRAMFAAVIEATQRVAACS